MTQDPDYFARRAAQERARAERTQDRCARLLHLDLAKRYAELAAEAARTPFLADA